MQKLISKLYLIKKKSQQIKYNYMNTMTIEENVRLSHWFNFILIYLI